MTVIVGVDKLDVLIKKLDKVRDEFQDECLRRLQDYSPVRTGLLRDSWQVTYNADSGVLNFENDAQNEQGDYYAPFVEFGTYKMPGAFMATRVQGEADGILQLALRKAGL